MGKDLDLDDVSYDHPYAKAELAELRERVRELESSVDYWLKKALEAENKVCTLEIEQDAAIRELSKWSREAGRLEARLGRVLREVGEDEIKLIYEALCWYTSKRHAFASDIAQKSYRKRDGSKPTRSEVLEASKCSDLCDKIIDRLRAIVERKENNMEKPINILFDGPPGPESGRFVEVETDDGKSIRAGEWIEREDGLWALRITALPVT